jgi:putative redox protein
MIPRKGPSHVHVVWVGDQQFDSGRPGGPVARIDSSGATGQSPVDALLSALATCTSVDVIEILAKRRTPAGRLAVDVTAERAAEVPARVIHFLLAYEIDGPGIDRGAAERGIDLALSKYCSVRGSLDPAIPIEFSLTLNGEPGGRLRTGSIVGGDAASATGHSGTAPIR